MLNTTKTGIYKCQKCDAVKTLTIKQYNQLPKKCYCDNCRKNLMIQTLEVRR